MIRIMQDASILEIDVGQQYALSLSRLDHHAVMREVVLSSGFHLRTDQCNGISKTKHDPNRLPPYAPQSLNGPVNSFLQNEEKKNLRGTCNVLSARLNIVQCGRSRSISCSDHLGFGMR